MVMGIFGWIMLGLIVGYIANLLVNKPGEGLPFDILLGILGAVLGGLFFHAFGSTGMTEFSVRSLLIAVVGAVALLWVWHSIRRSAWHA